jgi:hypothetical protein
MQETGSKTVEKKFAAVSQVILAYDRIGESNPDSELIDEKIRQQLSVGNKITLTVFTCLDWNPKSLTGDKPEEFILTESRSQDLFTPRIKKINSMQNDLGSLGIDCEILLVIGDTDIQDYFQDVLKLGNIEMNYKKLIERQNQYCLSFTQRAGNILSIEPTVIKYGDYRQKSNTEVVDLGLIEEVKSGMRIAYTQSKFFGGINIPYDEKVFEKAAFGKISLYGQQGYIIEKNGGLVLQTELPWLTSTRMLKSAGANIAAIYPWVRKEELSSDTIR